MTDNTRDLPDHELDDAAEKALSDFLAELTAPKRKKDEE